MAEKIIRDPVHDVIAFRIDRPAEALLFRLINATEFQRLRRIRQLGMADLTYPGADHSRYSHSLGVMETARKMLAQLARSQPIDPAKELVCWAGALLHDLGHGPFSHVFERIAEVDHEEYTRAIIEDPESEVHQILKSHDAALPGAVSGVLNGGEHPTFLNDILASQLDADRLDYLLRDNLMTGSQYGGYDLNWLLHALCIDDASGRLAVTVKGISAVEAYLQARYHMYRNVYLHKTVRSAEGMVRLALQRAGLLAVQGRLHWPPREHVVYRALVGLRLSTVQFTDLDDVSIQHCFKQWCSADDPLLAALCHGLLFRKLYKTIDLSDLDAEAAESAFARAKAAVGEAGGNEVYEIIYDDPSETPYESPPSIGVEEIQVLDRGGHLRPFSVQSPMSQALSQQLTFRRIHVAPVWRDRALSAINLPRDVRIGHD